VCADDAESRAWHRLTADEQAALTAAGHSHVWPSGEIIARQGAPPGSMFIVLRGWVKISVTNERGDHAPIAARGPGEIVGELAPISDRPRTATIETITEVHTLAIPPDRLRSVLRRRPHIAEELLRAAAIRLEQSAHLHLEAGGPDFTQRLAAVLLELAIQCAPGPLDNTPIDLPFPQEELAGLARVSRRTLIRGLKKLRTHGVLTTTRGRVTILRPAALRHLASGKNPS
jgi:CRP/FNR family cyclic AMP-dependent transcriptional regulator